MGNEKPDYRAIPFWSWNGELRKERLDEQMRDMKDRGFGGVFMHARGGLKTEYLSEKWFDAVGFCIEKGKEYGLQPWVYDENGWPSGFADGKLLEEKYFIAHLECEENVAFKKDALGNFRYEKNAWVRKTEDDGGLYTVVNVKYNFTYVDLMNPEVAVAFVREVHEKYKERFGNRFVGFFTDEPQYSREGIPWSSYLKKEYENRIGKPIENDLVYLFKKCGDVSKKIRYDYYTLANELFLGFIKYIYDWCKLNGYKLTGHTIDENWIFGQIACCGDVSPFYEYEDVPGIDWLSKCRGRNNAPKQCSSVAEQLGKQQTLSETFGASGWNTSPRTLKSIVDFQLANGINTFCYHLYAYSVIGERKHDFPPFFSEHSEWMKYSRKLTDYFNRVGELLGNGKKEPKVILLHSLSSAYMEFERYEPESVRFAENAFGEATDYLTNRLIPYHIGDEVIMSKHGRVSGDKLIVGEVSYDCVVLPNITNMRSSTYSLLNEFIKNGGKVVSFGKSLKYKDGLPFTYDIEANTKKSELINYSPIRVSGGNGYQSYLSVYDDKKVLFVMNYSDSPIKASFTCDSEPIVFDAFENKYYKAKKVGGRYDISLMPDESRIYILDSDICGEDIPKVKSERIIDGVFDFVSGENCMPLDEVSYSLDGGEFSEKKNILRVGKELLDMRFNGKVRLKFDFENRGCRDSLCFFSEPYKNASVYLNGKKCEIGEKRFIDRDLPCYKLENLKTGTNEIIEEFDYFQRDEVYYVLYTEGVSETLRNKLVYDTEIDMSYITGDFEVGFEKFGSYNNSYLVKGLYLRERGTKVNIEDLADSGYPFLCGDLTVSKKVDNLRGTIEIDSEVQTVCVIDSDNNEKVLYGFNKVDLGEGCDELKLVVTPSLRNLFGPLHNAESDPKVVAPEDFYKLDGSEAIYSLIKTGVREIKIKEWKKRKMF